MRGIRAVLYARVSSPAQKRRNQADLDEPSLSQQTGEMKAAADARDWIVVASLEEVVPGAVPFKSRPAGSKVYAMAGAGEFDVLMVYDNDRIGRDEDAVVAKVFRADMRFLGKQMFSVHQPVEPKPPDEYQPYEDDSALWLESVSDTSSSVAIRQFRRRHAFGMRKRIETKKLMAGTCPTGFTADRHVLPNGRTFLGQRSLDPDYAPIVARIFNEYEAGHSLMKIAGILNSEALRTPSGKLWSSTTIKGIINNPAYYGATVYYKDRSIGKPDPHRPGRRRRVHQPIDRWLIVDDAQHPAIITKQQWERCQVIKSSRGSFGRTYGESTLLSGLVRCGRCGYAMHRNGGWGGGYFSCNRYWKTGKTECSPNSVKRQKLEAEVVAYLGSLAASPQILTELHLVQTRAGVRRLRRDLGLLQEHRKNVETRLERAREAYEAGADTVMEYTERKRALSKQRAALQAKLERTEQELILASQRCEVHESLVRLMRQFPVLFSRRPLTLQKMLLHEIVDHVAVDGTQIRVVFKESVFTSSDYERAMEIVRLYSEGSNAQEAA